MLNEIQQNKILVSVIVNPLLLFICSSHWTVAPTQLLTLEQKNGFSGISLVPLSGWSTILDVNNNIVAEINQDDEEMICR